MQIKTCTTTRSFLYLKCMSYVLAQYLVNRYKLIEENIENPHAYINTNRTCATFVFVSKSYSRRSKDRCASTQRPKKTVTFIGEKPYICIPQTLIC